jgi:hypothetical protein
VGLICHVTRTLYTGDPSFSKQSFTLFNCGASPGALDASTAAFILPGVVLLFQKAERAYLFWDENMLWRILPEFSKNGRVAPDGQTFLGHAGAPALAGCCNDRCP